MMGVIGVDKTWTKKAPPPVVGVLYISVENGRTPHPSSLTRCHLPLKGKAFLFASFVNCYGNSNGCADHGVVTHADKSHHLDIKVRRGRTFGLLMRLRHNFSKLNEAHHSHMYIILFLYFYQPTIPKTAPTKNIKKQ